MLGSKKVFIMFGMNDIGLYGIDDTIENMKTLTSRIKEKVLMLRFIFSL